MRCSQPKPPAWRPATALALAALLGLGACSSHHGRPGGDRPLKPIAEPGNVAASDIAFARALRDEGESTAFRRFAAESAVVHLPEGPVPAADWLARQPDAEAAVDWEPRAVWTSCDGSLAVSFGRTQAASGLVGSYVTAWQRQRNGTYRWTYHTSALDDPQPAPRPQEAVPEGDNVIVVPGFNAIEGKAADCVRAASPPRATGAAITGAASDGMTFSEDRTLQWRWEQRASGGGRVVVDYLRDGRWQQALDFNIPPSTKP